MGKLVPIRILLTEIMTSQGWNQQELATNLKLEASQISRWLNGKTQPRIDVYEALREKHDELVVA